MQQFAHGHNNADPQGRDAISPTQLPLRAWKENLGRVWVKTGTDNIGLLAAGVAFFAFLAFVPLLGALIMIYGLIADPKTIADHMHIVISLVPKDAAKRSCQICGAAFCQMG